MLSIRAILLGCLHVSAAWATNLHCANHPIGDVTPARLERAADEPGEWLTGGRDWRQSYYSPLSFINTRNVAKLGYAWSYDIDFSASFQATPIVVDGVMYTSGNYGNVYSLDARTGALRWHFEPKIDQTVMRSHCCAGVNRGVAVWRGKVYVAATDGQLYALDARSGAVVWKTRTIQDMQRSYSSTGAPYIAKDLVIIGNSGAEYDARGYITAYDTQTGREAWRFYTVPGDPKKGFEHPELEMAAKTWDPNSLWAVGLGGTAWDGMAYDRELNLLYVGTGNGTPWVRSIRSPSGGDNLFLSSILAINPDTGRLVWHYQTTPGDNWDYTATQKIILADLIIDGKPRKVLLQAPKNGFFYVIDRASGELLSAKPIVYVNWASHIDMTSGKPVETGKGDYSKSPRLVFPTTQGAHNWNPMSFNQNTGLVYVPVQEAGEVYTSRPEPFAYGKGEPNIGVVQRGLASLANPTDGLSLAAIRGNEPDPTPRRYLRAWDPVRQKLVWQVEMPRGTEPDFTTRKIAGVMSTGGGLVFQGDFAGHLLAYDARSGKKLHDIDVGTSMTAAPMTYTVEGEQYIAIMAGASTTDPDFADYRYGKRGRILSFKLGGGAVPQRPLRNLSADTQPPPPVPESERAEEQSRIGARLFGTHCAVCHVNSGRAPDLTRMNAQTHAEFTDIVLKGKRLAKGMPSFQGVLSEEDAQTIRGYVTGFAWKRYRSEMSKSGAKGAAMPQGKGGVAQTAMCPEPRTSDKPLDLLIVTGSHAYEPSEFFAAFAAMPNIRFQHLMLANGRLISTPVGGVGQYEAILFFDFEPGEVTDEWRELLARGKGYVFLHHALGTFPKSPQIKAIIGGHANFTQDVLPGSSNTTAHPNQKQRFTVTDPKHPITCGIGDFDMLDEPYDKFDVDPGVHVLMRSDFPKNTRAAAWTWHYQSRRVVFLQPGHGSIGLPPGHGPSSYQNDTFRKLMERSIQWSAGRL